jgi:hypothetical protein
MKIAIIPGRFQGVTVFHEKIIHDASTSFDKVIIVIINGEKSSKDTVKNPFSVYTREGLLLEVIKDLTNVDIISYKSAYLQDMLDDMVVLFGLDRIDDEITICCGSDRLNSYTNQVKSIVGFRNIIVRGYFRKLKVSASLLRDSIINNDYHNFKKLSPEKLHNYFFVLQSILTSHI